MQFFEERIGKLLEELGALRYRTVQTLTDFRYLPQGERYEKIAELPKEGWQPFDKNCEWGGDNVCAWFQADYAVPQEMDGKCAALLVEIDEGWDATNTQFRAYINGELRQGLDVNHREIILTEKAKAGESYNLTLRAFSGVQREHLRMVLHACILDRDVEKYYYDVKVPLGVARCLPREDENYIKIIQALNHSLNLLDLRHVPEAQFRASLQAAQEDLTREFYEKLCGDKPEKVYCVGHTHIDVAWLWTLAVTQDKAVRSFSSMLELMRQYPEFIFMSSQPQLYKYVQQDAPEVFEEIKARIAQNRWEPEGAMFLEADCNLTSGESLVRQIVHGKRYFRQQFGRDNEIVWLPDVFGYSAALPQIMKRSGVKYFMTTKISWNEINKMPYDTFLWQGIDGSEILTHFSTTRNYDMDRERRAIEPGTGTTYVAMLSPIQVMGAWQRYQQKDVNTETLMTCGYGDGGGGTTREMLENQRRMAKGIPGCPQTVFSTADEFFHILDEHCRNSHFLPRWVGELYLEYHRGTYTGMARNKRYNRKSEFAYQEAELFSLMAQKRAGLAYPKARLNAGWEVILRNQFHDILPGSSIKEVYEDSKAEYEKIAEESAEMLQSARQALADSLAAPQGALVAFNPAGFDNNGPVLCDGPADVTVLSGGAPLPTQRTHDSRLVFDGGMIPGKGYKAFALAPAVPQKGSITFDGRTLETPFYRVRFNEKAQFESLFDKRAGREVLRPGQAGNVLMTYEDKPHNFDAWDLNNYYTEKSWEMDQVSGVEVLEQGPVRTVIRVTRPYLSSTCVQDIIFYERHPRIDFETKIDWHEHQIFVKALFPVDIQASEATYEIQYGHVTRPTHYNTSWDFARFEVCHHKWLDFSEAGYGVSVLNDCKYGASVHDGVIGLSLIKSGVYPNPDADNELHTFTYSLLPHEGCWRKAGVVKEAYLLNQPASCAIKQTAAGALPAQGFAVRSNAANVVVEVVKQAEDDEDTIIRVYEAYRRRTQATLELESEIAACQECDLMEENEQPVSWDAHHISFEIRPFEIRTFRLRLR